MERQPSGTVTHLFTDVEGSTRLWERHPEAVRTALARHDALVREAIAAHGGHLVKATGDGAHAAFATAHAALQAALAAQRALQAEAWEGVVIKVRMGLHSGAAEERAGDYYGTAPNRAARLMSAGHGGQILLSRATRELVADHLPDGVALRDLGLHRLKDLSRPEQIFQVLAPGLPSQFPPLRTLETQPNNLPAQATPFLGRAAQLAAVREALARPEVRLLTLTGPGGTGKTRLALQAAADLLEAFEDGVFFVALAPIRDPALVLPTVAATLGLREGGAGPVLDLLQDYLRHKRMLLVLDNFEQVVAAGPEVGDLLASAPRLRALATSRRLLQVYGEVGYPVPPMALPQPRHLPSLERLAEAETVQLFVQRAAAVRAGFALTEDNAVPVAEICARLDGLPLAIELAAVRVRLLPPAEILSRLGDRFRLLTGGPRDLPDRQRTLRATLDWSYDLLEASEQALFRHLAVFAGGWSLEAAEAVCDSPGGLDVLDGLQGLVDKSLVYAVEAGGAPRFGMLETIREYALERLEAGGEAAEEATRRAHAAHFLALAEEAEAEYQGPQGAAWMDRLDREHDNLRAALTWSLSRGTADPLAAETALRLAGALGMFWYIRGLLNQARGWLERALAIAAPVRREPGQEDPRAKALVMAGLIAWQQGDYAAARPFFEEGVARWRASREPKGLSEGLHLFGHLALDEGRHSEARVLWQESLAIYRRRGDKHSSLVLMQDLGLLAYHQGDLAEAQAQFELGLAAARELGWDNLSGLALNRLGELARLRGDWQGSAELFEQSLAHFHAARSKMEAASVLKNQGHVALRLGDRQRARALFAESLALQQEYGNKQGVAECLAGLAAVAPDPRAAARLFGAVVALLDAVGAPLSPADQADLDLHTAAVRARLGEAAFEAAWAEGQAMAAAGTPAPWERVIACALGEP